MSKKTPFQEPIKDHTPHKTQGPPWNFDTIPYDQRHSSFISAGLDHGVGHKQPVGDKMKATDNRKCVPLGIKIEDC